jgi:D-alanine-D-alanine ligase
MNVNVVMGGPSSEYDISILSGVEMVRHLLGRSHAVRAVVVSADRRFYYCDIGSDVPAVEHFSDPTSSPLFSGPFPAWSCEEVWAGRDVAVLALHGAFGEDGTVQGYLETLGIPYTGSGVRASSLAMDKIATKYLLAHNGIATPKYLVCEAREPQATLANVPETLGFPCYVKCPHSGSSKLMARAGSPEELADAVRELSRHAERLLIEAAVEGPEFSCPALEQPDGTVRALPPVEIRPVSSPFFDYRAKYTTGACEEIVPAPRPPALLQRVEHIAVQVHRLLGCHGVTRTDMILSEDALYVLEINTLPGFTANSLVPKSYGAAGGTYEQLIDLLVELAVHRPPHEVS